ncbi:hypothetical protein ACLB1E_04765 [Escherichia coli]
MVKHKTITFEEIAGKGKNQLTFNQIALDEAWDVTPPRCRRPPCSCI